MPATWDADIANADERERGRLAEFVDETIDVGSLEMDVELIESDDDDVDMEPSKMTLVEWREFLKGIANFFDQETGLGDEDLLQTSKQGTDNASNVWYEPQATGQSRISGSGYTRSC